MNGKCTLWSELCNPEFVNFLILSTGSCENDSFQNADYMN